MKKVGIVMGSDSDLPILRKAMDMLDTLAVHDDSDFLHNYLQKSIKGRTNLTIR